MPKIKNYLNLTENIFSIKLWRRDIKLAIFSHLMLLMHLKSCPKPPYGEKVTFVLRYGNILKWKVSNSVKRVAQNRHNTIINSASVKFTLGSPNFRLSCRSYAFFRLPLTCLPQQGKHLTVLVCSRHLLRNRVKSARRKTLSSCLAL